MAEIDLIKISELPATSTIGDADELAVVQGGATKKVPYSALKAGAEVTPDTTLSEAGVPADAAAVGAALALKANQAAVTQALAAKADKTEVTGISGDIAELASVVETKADQTALNQKADKTTTDALRQDLTTLNGIVNQKADKTELNTQIGNVTAELATKANTADVNNLLAAKANVASPVFTGRPQAPTAPKGTATLQLATTAFVQNAIDDKQDTLTFDSTPTEGSTNPVTSGGVWEAVQTDKTLAVEDKAADAKATGNTIAELKSDLMPLNETASATSTGVGDYFVYYPISAGDRIKAVSTVGVNIHTRATKTGANIEELGYVKAGLPKIFTATADASWFKMYFVGAGTITFENMSKRVPVLEESMAKAEESISDLGNTFDEAITSNVNYLERTNVDNNYIWSRNTGNKSASQYANAFDAIPIKKGKTYYFRNIYAYFSLIKKSDGTFTPLTDDTSGSYSGTYIADDDDVYACITVSNDSSISGYIFTDSEKMYNDANPYTYFEPNKLQVGGKVLNVGSTREYTRLRDGVAEAIKYKDSTVCVDAGTYDLCTEFASEITANQAGVKFGIGLGNGVRVIFEAGAKVVANYTGGVQNITSYFNPFHLTGDGCFTLENADIDVKNTRYCVHDEWSGHTKARTVKYINCKMVMDNTNAVINWYPQCIGGGNGASDYISIENCYFKSKMAESAIVPLVSYHNNNSGTEDMKSDVHMSNCYFADKGTFRCTYSGQATAVSSAYVNNCSLGANPIVGQEQSGGTAPVNYELITWMNEIRS